MSRGAQPPAQAGPGVAGWGFLVLAVICSALAYTDRQYVSLVVGPLEHSLHIGDAQAGLLQGLAFSLCYAVAGFPLGVAVDKGPRVAVASGCIAVWSLATGACGIAAGFGAFLTARAFTACSEAGFSPSVLSMISDRFSRRAIPPATAIYLMAPPVGTASALVLGGALLEHFTRTGGLVLPGVGRLEAWQSVFVALMVPGLVFAVLFSLLVRDPPRRDPRHGAAAGAPVSLRRELSARRGLLILYVTGIAIIMMSTFALSAWAPTLFARRFSLAPAQVGKTLGPIFLVASLAGAVISSLLSGRASDEGVLPRVLGIIGVAAALLCPCVVGLCLAASYSVALGLYGLCGLVAGVATCLATAPIQLTVSPGVRARAIAVGGFLLAVLGAGGGPYFTGLLTEKLFHDPAAVGRSLAIVSVASAVVGLPLVFHAWRQARDASSVKPLVTA